MLKRRTVILLCSGFFVVGFVSGLSFLGFASILVPGTHANGYSQPIRSYQSLASSPTAVFPSPTPTVCPTLTPAPVPTVTSISPTSGPVSGGTTVTITGTGFTGASKVLFGSVPASNFKVTSDTQIIAVSPAGSGTVHITVTTPGGGTSATSTADQFTYVLPTPAPSMLTVDPPALMFTTSQGNNPASQHISITNTGGRQLDWTATVSTGTVFISPVSGSGLAGGLTASITVTVNTTGLAAGHYTSEIIISGIDHITGQSVAGSPSTVNIHLTITSSRSTGSPTPIPPTPTPVLCPTPSPTPTPTPEEGLGFAQK